MYQKEPKKILVVDDEKNIRMLLEECLTMEGYQVDTAENGTQAISKLAGKPDLIILDVNMPDLDGYQVCERIRNYVSCPILFLTARTREQDRVSGFKAGGDDYITKPFGMEEMLARVEAHLRREERRMDASCPSADIGELLLDREGRRLLFQDKEIPLTKTEFNIVELLAANPGRVFGKEQIYDLVRGMESSGDPNIIMEHIRRIRIKLAKYSEQEYIVTVWGVGYRWEG